MKRIFTMLLLLLISCGSETTLKTDDVFEQYKQRFTIDTKLDASHISIIFGEMDAKWYALCYYDSDGNYIHINKTPWETLSDIRREILIYHELGHCLLGKDHYDVDIFFNGYRCPSSIVTTLLFTENQIQHCYLPEKEYYINELLN